jgi:hypothetical protein
VSFQRFLGKSEIVVAPIVDGVVWLRDRSVRCRAQPGWYRVKVSGRTVTPEAPADPEEIERTFAPLPLVRGPIVALDGGWGVVAGGARCARVALAPADEPLPLSPLRARRWPLGELLLWEALDFDGEIEELVRRALEEGRGIDELKGVPAPLRAAFVFSLARATGRQLGIPAAPLELGRWIGAIATQGRPAAEEALRELARERAVHAARLRPPPPPPTPRPGDLEQRVERALRNTGATLRGVRRTDGLVEVRWSFHDQRFVTLVEEGGLRVVDSGVCLAGEDDLVTLESLPGVLEEAIREQHLVITRHEGDDDA